MKKRLLLLPALALVLSACTGPAGESAPPAETDIPAPSVSSGGPAPSAPESAPSEPPTAEDFDSVYTDWSRLEPYRPDLGLYTRYYDRPVDRLLAVEGGYGGPLISFVGSELWDPHGWNYALNYGLARLDGTVVCDPVYEGISYFSFCDRELEQDGENNGFLILSRTSFEGDYDSVHDWMKEYVYTVAARDGSWVLEEEYSDYFELSDGRLLLADAGGGLWFCGRDGVLTPSPLMDTFSRREEADWGEIVRSRGSFYDGAGVFQDPEGRGRWLLNAITGEVKHLSDVTYCYGWPDGSPLAMAYTEDRCGRLYGYLDRNGDWAIPPQFRNAREFEGDFAAVELAEGGYALIDRSGEAAARLHGYAYMGTDRNGTIYYLDNPWDEMGKTIIAVYDQEGRLLPDHPLAGRRASAEHCAVTIAEDQVIGNLTVRNGIMTIWDYDGTYLGTVEGAQSLSLLSCENGRAVLHKGTAADWSEGVYDLAAGAWIVPLDKYPVVQVVTDGTDTFYTASKYGGSCDILREDGTLAAHVDTYYEFTQGVFQCRQGGDSVWLDRNGEEVFRWPIWSNSD